MTTIGWILFGVICLVSVYCVTLFIKKRNPKLLDKIIAAALAIAICVGGYFLMETWFNAPPEVEEEPVIEETVEEPAEEVTEEDHA